MISSLPGFHYVYTNKEQAGHSSHKKNVYKVTVRLRKAGYELAFHMAEHKKTSLYSVVQKDGLNFLNYIFQCF